MKKLIEEYNEIILNVVANALFYIMFFVVIGAIYKLCISDMQYLIK